MSGPLVGDSWKEHAKVAKKVLAVLQRETETTGQAAMALAILLSKLIADDPLLEMWWHRNFPTIVEAAREATLEGQQTKH